MSQPTPLQTTQIEKASSTESTGSHETTMSYEAAQLEYAMRPDPPGHHGREVVPLQAVPGYKRVGEQKETEKISPEDLFPPSPEDKSWLLGRIFFWWESPLFTLAAKLSKEGKALEHDDLVPLPRLDHSIVIGPRFEDAWARTTPQSSPSRKKKSKNEGSEDTAETAQASRKLSDLNKPGADRSTKRLQKALLKVMGRQFIIAGFIKAINTALQFCFPILLNSIVSFIEDAAAGEVDPDAPWYESKRGYWLSAILFVAMGCKAITESSYFHMVNKCGYRAKMAVSVATYHKSLRLANAERQSTTLGELVNLMQVDAAKIEMFVPQCHVLWDGAFQIVGYLTILYTLIGWPCFAGVFVMICAGPVQAVIMMKMHGLNRAMVKHMDERVETTNEALQGIQCVKMYTWEESFANEISQARHKELVMLKSLAYLRGFSRAYMGALPGIVAVTTFVVYALFKKDADISASTLFAALVAFEQLRFPLLFYPMCFALMSQAQVSAARVEVFLGMKEVGKGEKSSIGSGLYHRIPEAGRFRAGEIVLRDATIFWNDPSVPLEINGEQSGEQFSTSELGSTMRDSTHGASNSDAGVSAEGSADPETPEIAYPKAILRNVTMRVGPGELCAVIGRVGSGKSTLCSAILNEALLESGDVTLKGKVAYAAQSPWILNATLRDNILFGMPFDKYKYNRVIRACQLEHDLRLLDDGDMTEIGERGINLSGGQKARVSVARAAYSDADTIILDDPLSALDPEVGQRLFEECIMTHLQGKTRLFVTNQLQFLQRCDSVVALGGRRVLEQGSYDDLMAAESGEVKRLLTKLAKENAKQKEAQEEAAKANKEKKEDDVVAKKSHHPVKEEKEKALTKTNTRKDPRALHTKEERNVGAVSFSVYLKYMVAGGGYLKFFCVYFAFILSAANQIGTSYWVSFWTSDAEYEIHPQAFYLGFYFMLACTLGMFTFNSSFNLVRFANQASETMHKNLLQSIFRAPQSFFDTTPLGRILSRFSKDMSSIDLEVGEFFDFFLFAQLQITFSLATIMFVTPWFGVAIIPLIFFYIRFMNYFREVSRETKRLESISRSPVYALFSETLGGLDTIRAYGDTDRFRNDFESRVDENTRAFYCNKAAERWLAVRLEFIGSTIAALAGSIATNVALNGSGDEQFASLAGLSLTVAISITSLLQWGVRAFAQLEASMNSVERALYYTEEIPQEAAWTSNALVKETSSLSKDGTPFPESNPSAFAVHAAGGKADQFSLEWPESGAIELKDLRMRYRSDTPLVLKGLNVHIRGGERVGVVGRTGSGKSSLLLTLLRLVEPSLEHFTEQNYAPPISIDGVDVLRIGLRELRGRLGIIPQNPVLFSGTIRSNIDPFNDYTDEQIWTALEQCGLKDSVEAMPGQLLAHVSEYGGNLSAGSRQMLVLGRALLRQCRILLLDEATSSVDMETDREIQRTLREAFPGCTVLTIAHRINTIMDSDKILVMKDGVAAEFAPPQQLLEDEGSLFAEIVRHAEAEQGE